MQGFPRTLGAKNFIFERCIFKKRTVIDRLMNPNLILHYPTPRADIHMSHFRVSHHAIRKPHGKTRCLKRGIRIFFQEFQIVRRVRLRDGIPLFFGTNSPTVNYN